MAKTKTPLKEYAKKRHFLKTPEPPAKVKKRKTKKPIFVIQKHDASHLHYDFRIEVDGVLKSWAIPKGPSTDPKQKRLAVPTEDHPMDYAKFEGIIPQGQYGGGTVMVWDIGTYENIKPESIEQSIDDGQIEINLHGKKLHGNYVLIRTNFRGKESWLFKKMNDDYASSKKEIVDVKKKSVLTDRTLDQIANAGKKKESTMAKLTNKFSKQIEKIKKTKKNAKSKNR